MSKRGLILDAACSSMPLQMFWGCSEMRREPFEDEDTVASQLLPDDQIQRRNQLWMRHHLVEDSEGEEKKEFATDSLLFQRGGDGDDDNVDDGCVDTDD
jgi:hypothetical protein